MAYDKDTDYQAIIDRAVANGDYETAARAEQSRNEKIADLNASGTNIYGATATNKYSGWLDDTDYGEIGKQQMASGARPEEVLQTYTNRLNKASGTEGLTQYANDELQQSMLDYILNYEEKPSSGGFTYSSAPTYKDSYSERIDAMLDKVLNRDQFTYDVTSDPLYAQYQQQYNLAGDRAMRDTLGAVSARTGGLASSYATTAAQQANQEYANRLASMVPELYQLAYQMYLDDIDLQVQDLGLLNNASDTAYNRYRDTMSDWRNDRDFAYGVYRDDAADQKWQTEFDYAVGRDQVADERYEQEWNYNIGRDQVADDRYDREWQYALDRDRLEDERYEREWALQQQSAVKKQSGSGGSGGTGGSKGSDKILDTIMGMDNAEDVRAYLLSTGEAQWRVNAYYSMWEDAQKPDEEEQETNQTPETAPGSDTFTDYSTAVAYMKKNGVPNAQAAGAMTASEWSRRRSSYLAYGQGGTEAMEFDNYPDYLTYYVDYCIEQYGR